MLAVDEQAHAIARVKRELRESDRGGARVVELGVAPPIRIVRVAQDAALQQPSGVENNPHRLAALGLVAPRDQCSAPRRGRPADVAQVVTFEILAEALEVAAKSALAHLAQFEIDLTAAREKDLLVFALSKRGIDAHGLLERGRGVGPTLEHASAVVILTSRGTPRSWSSGIGASSTAWPAAPGPPWRISFPRGRSKRELLALLGLARSPGLLPACSTAAPIEVFMGGTRVEELHGVRRRSRP